MPDQKPVSKPLPRYIKIDDLTIHRGVHVFLPDDVVIKANYVMRKQGYSRLRPWVIMLIRERIDEYFREHPEELEEVRILENKYREVIKKYKKHRG